MAVAKRQPKSEAASPSSPLMAPTSSVTLSFPSRFFPVAGVGTFIITMVLCIGLNRYYEHPIGGIYWPYISDTAKLPPEQAIFGFGMTITCVWIIASVTLHYGKVKRDLEQLQRKGVANVSGHKRNISALVAGLGAAPFLGLLAVYDTERTPGLHLLFVLFFFPLVLGFTFTTTSMLGYMLHKYETHKDAVKASELAELRRSVRAKRLICVFLTVCVSLYLPIGMAMVTDWYEYSNDKAVHTFRAVFQHLSVLCIVLFFGTFWWDFGSIRMTVVQSVEN